MHVLCALAYLMQQASGLQRMSAGFNGSMYNCLFTKHIHWKPRALATCRRKSCSEYRARSSLKSMFCSSHYIKPHALTGNHHRHVAGHYRSSLGSPVSAYLLDLARFQKASWVCRKVDRLEPPHDSCCCSVVLVLGAPRSAQTVPLSSRSINGAVLVRGVWVFPLRPVSACWPRTSMTGRSSRSVETATQRLGAARRVGNGKPSPSDAKPFRAAVRER